MKERLKSREASILKDLVLRAGASGRVTLSPRARPLVLPLWRNGLVEIWYRQVPDNEPSLRGPFYALTVAGFAVGSAIWAASRKPKDLSIQRPTRRRARQTQGATHAYPRLRPEPGTGFPGRRCDHSDPG